MGLNGTDGTCSVVNDDNPTTLRLIKNVTNNNGGTAINSTWTLNATGLNNNTDDYSQPGHAP